MGQFLMWYGKKFAKKMKNREFLPWETDQYFQTLNHYRDSNFTQKWPQQWYKQKVYSRSGLSQNWVNFRHLVKFVSKIAIFTHIPKLQKLQKPNFFKENSLEAKNLN